MVSGFRSGRSQMRSMIAQDSTIGRIRIAPVTPASSAPAEADDEHGERREPQMVAIDFWNNEIVFLVPKLGLGHAHLSGKFHFAVRVGGSRDAVALNATPVTKHSFRRKFAIRGPQLRKEGKDRSKVGKLLAAIAGTLRR